MLDCGCPQRGQRSCDARRGRAAERHRTSRSACGGWIARGPDGVEEEVDDGVAFDSDQQRRDPRALPTRRPSFPSTTSGRSAIRSRGGPSRALHLAPQCKPDLPPTASGASSRPAWIDGRQDVLAHRSSPDAAPELSRPRPLRHRDPHGILRPAVHDEIGWKMVSARLFEEHGTAVTLFPQCSASFVRDVEVSFYPGAVVYALVYGQLGLMGVRIVGVVSAFVIIGLLGALACRPIERRSTRLAALAALAAFLGLDVMPFIFILVRNEQMMLLCIISFASFRSRPISTKSHGSPDGSFRSRSCWRHPSSSTATPRRSSCSPSFLHLRCSPLRGIVRGGSRSSCRSSCSPRFRTSSAVGHGRTAKMLRSPRPDWSILPSPRDSSSRPPHSSSTSAWKIS